MYISEHGEGIYVPPKASVDWRFESHSYKVAKNEYSINMPLHGTPLIEK